MNMRRSAFNLRYVHWIFVGVVILFWLVQFMLIDKLLLIESYTGPLAARSASSYSNKIAVIHNPSYSWRREDFIKANSQIQNYHFNWFSNSTNKFPVDCKLSYFIYKRCPTQSEISHLTRHRLAWSWIASLRYPFGLIAEDIAVFVSEESLQEVLEKFLTGGLDILGLYAPQKNVIQQEMLREHGQIVRSDCIPFSTAYVVSRRAARLLSARTGPQAGAIIDHLCFLAREHRLKVGHVNGINATLVHKRSDFSVLLDGRGWIKGDLSGFHCAPPPEDPSFRASIQIAETPEHSSFPDVSWPAPIQHRVFINLENNFPELRTEPWLAEAGAVLTFKPIPGPADWVRLTYALGYEEVYRSGGRGWAERGEELVYWISHCVEERMELLREINRHTPTLSLSSCTAEGSRSAPDGFPGCPRNRDVRLGYNEEKHCVYARSRLALALENSRGEGYMTEKLWLPLLAGAVPVYYGAPDVADWLPAPDAAIDLTSFPGVAEGIAYARRVASDQNLWAQHTAWRARPFSLRFLHALRNSLPNLFCNLDPAQLPLARLHTLQ